MEKEFTPRPGRLMDQVRETLRFFHYAPSTEKSYIQWILRYIALMTNATRRQRIIMRLGGF